VVNEKHRGAFAADPAFQARIAKSKSTIELAMPTDCSEPSPEKKKSRAVLRAEAVRERNKDGRSDFVVYSLEKAAITFVFPGAVLLALNLSLRMHDAKASGMKDTWYERVRAVVMENRTRIKQWQDAAIYPLIAEEVYVTGETALLGTESVTASCKPILDALVRNGVIPDDSIKFIFQPIPYTERGPSPTLAISFRPSPKPWGHIEDETVQVCANGMQSEEQSSHIASIFRYAKH
jgi:hypothetical protein